MKSAVNADVAADVTAVADHLRLCIQARRLTLRSVESELGMGVGYLGQLLRGNLDLKLKQLLAVLRVIGMEPEEFFSSLYRGTLPTTPPRSFPSAVLPSRHGGGGLPGRQPGARESEVVPGVSEARLDDLIDQLLERVSQRDRLEKDEASPAPRKRDRKRK